MAHFVKRHENSSIWPKLDTFRVDYHVWAFWSTFQEKVSKSGSLREKARKLIDLGKTSNFSRKLSCFRVWVNYWGKSCKKWLILWKSTKNHRFGQKWELFKRTTMFRRFGQLFNKKLEKVAHFEKKLKKSSIWAKLVTFRVNYQVSAFWSTFQQKVAKSGSCRKKSMKNHRFGQN